MVADTAGGLVPAVPAVLIERIVRRFDPQRIILFGSQARGDAGPDSDWDLLIIVDDDAPPENLWLRTAYEAIMGTGIAADVVPVRAATFEYKRDVVNSISWFADTEGLVVYERVAQHRAA
jgi:predicted nucleotidyltransferase